MVLKEILLDNTYISYYNSSNILKSEYNPINKNLKIYFHKGGVYEYKNVTAYIYQRFKHSKSQGVGLKEHLTKNNTIFIRLDNINVTQINEIKEEIKKINHEII